MPKSAEANRDWVTHQQAVVYVPERALNAEKTEEKNLTAERMATTKEPRTGYDKSIEGKESAGTDRKTDPQGHRVG